jgi:hypothetical protein
MSASGGMTRFFTYGILKYPAQLLSHGATDIVEGATAVGHQMFVHQGKGFMFPVTKTTGVSSDVVFGTLCYIPTQVIIQHYDHVEGYNPKVPKERNLYNREIVNVALPDGKVVEAHMYIANQQAFAWNFAPQYRVRTGNFDDAQGVVHSLLPRSRASNKTSEKGSRGRNHRRGRSSRLSGGKGGRKR